MTKKIAILQSNYLPWIGYFEIINYVDEFIFLDDVQYTKGDWRNRNKIRINKKDSWITINIKSKGSLKKKINEIEIFDNNWKLNHLRIFKQCYSENNNFELIFQLIEKIYKELETTKLTDINQHIIKKICNFLNIRTIFSKSEEIETKMINNSERILEICLYKKATHYISGPNAKNYLDVNIFKKNNIEVIWFDYNKHLSYLDSNLNNLQYSIFDNLINYFEKIKKIHSLQI